MATLHMKDLTIHTQGILPDMGDKAPNVSLVKADLSTITLDDFMGKPVLLNVYLSIDTEVCFASVRKFNALVKDPSDIAVICVSMDLPFALKRIVEREQLKNIILTSDFRYREFGQSYGLTIADGPVAGLLARAVFVLDPGHNIIYRELVDDVTTPPRYDAAMASLEKILGN